MLRGHAYPGVDTRLRLQRAHQRRHLDGLRPSPEHKQDLLHRCPRLAASRVAILHVARSMYSGGAPRTRARSTCRGAAGRAATSSARSGPRESSYYRPVAVDPSRHEQLLAVSSVRSSCYSNIQTSRPASRPASFHGDRVHAARCGMFHNCYGRPHRRPPATTTNTGTRARSVTRRRPTNRACLSSRVTHRSARIFRRALRRLDSPLSSVQRVARARPSVAVARTEFLRRKMVLASHESVRGKCCECVTRRRIRQIDRSAFHFPHAKPARVSTAIPPPARRIRDDSPSAQPLPASAPTDGTNRPPREVGNACRRRRAG